MLDRLYTFEDIITLLKFLFNDMMRLLSPKSLASLIPIFSGPFLGILGLATGTLGKLPVIGYLITDLINGPSSKIYFYSQHSNYL